MRIVKKTMVSLLTKTTKVSHMLMSLFTKTKCINNLLTKMKPIICL